MRKSLFFGLIAALTLVVSCTFEPQDPYLFTKDMALTAITEQPTGTRTIVESGNQVWWEPGDEIAVFWKGWCGKFVSDLSAPASTATFLGSLAGWTGGSEIWAVYPYSDEASFDGQCITTTLPSRQTARAGSFAKDMNLAIAKSVNRTLEFYNVGGGVCFSVAEDSVKKVIFEGLNDEMLAGKVKVGFENGRPKVMEVTEGSRHITLLPPDGETFQKNQWYYIIAVPGALEKGFKMRFYKSSVYAQKVSEAAVTIKRSIYGCLEGADEGLEYVPVPELTEWTTDKTMRGIQYEEKGGGEGEGDEIVQMRPEALFVMDDLNNLLVSFDDKNWTITYRNGPALTDADIKVGDVLYSMPVGEIAPDGYLLRVIHVRKEGDRVVFDVEPTGLAAAFDHLSTDIPVDVNQLTEDCLTFYDILEQPDQSWQIGNFDANINSPVSIPTRSIFEDWSVDFSAVTDTNKLKIKFDAEEASVSYVLADGDKNPKTTYDQIRLVIRFEYGFDDCFHFEFDASREFLSLEFSPSLGITCGFQYGGKGTLDQVLDFLDIGDATPQLWDAGTVREMRAMQEKLMGKRIRICSIDLAKGMKAVKAIVRPTIDLYAYFKISLEGNLEVAFGFEKTRWHLGIENIPYSFQPNLNKMLHLADHLTPVAKFICSAEFKGSTGLGLGLVARLPSVAEKVSYKDPTTKEVEVPWMGFFCEWGLNAKAKTKNWVDVPSGKLHTDLSVDVYNEINGYLEAFAHLKNDLLFNPKVDLIHKRIPEESVYKYEYSWETEQRYPLPILISPSNREAIEDNSVSLQWKIPKPDKSFLAANEQFQDLTFYVYAGTNKNAVNSLNESCIVGYIQNPNDTTRFDLKSMDFTIENMKTYWWKVVCINRKGETYESPLSTFDCGYDGKLDFDLDLKRWLSDHFEALGDVYIQTDGTILRTLSNINALAALKTLEIKDGGAHYHIKSIDALLQNLPALETLDCRNNKITSLDLSHNPKLTSIVCNGNQISSLDLSRNRQLNNVSCKNNQLTELNLANLSKLENLSCSGNTDFEDLDISACPSLATMKCDSCNFRTLDLSNNQNLIGLFATNNRIDSLDISRCPILIRLDVYDQYAVPLMILRLTHAQHDGFALFKRHVYMDLQYVDVSGIETEEATDITNHSAVIKVNALDRKNYSSLRVYYAYKEYYLEHDSEFAKSEIVYDKVSHSFLLDKLLPDTDYYARGCGYDSESKQFVYGNTIHFKTLPGDPAPQFSDSVDEDEYDAFKTVLVGTRATQKVTITNTGQLDLVYQVINNENSPFRLTPTTECTLAPGASKIHTMSFTPTQAGDFYDIITIRSNDPKGDIHYYVWGTAIGDDLPAGTPRIVDLGLSVHWASYNLGASRPESLGKKFAWGETNTWKNHSGVENPWAYYKWSDADDPDLAEGSLLTKYCSYHDEKTVLDPEDDAAYQYLGGHWRMPTREEWSELSYSCDKTWSSNVVQFTSRINGESIYLPITSYWTSSLYWDDYGASVEINETSIKTSYCYEERWKGLAIRPVYFVPIESVSLNKSLIEVNNFERDVVLKATVTPADATRKHFVWEVDTPNIVNYIPQDGGDTRTVSFDWAIGSTDITVYADDGKNPAKTATCRVVSKIYIEGAEIITPNIETSPNYYDDHTFHIIPGEKLSFSSIYHPENASEFTDSRQWISDDPSVAFISENGLVTGIKSGSTTIRVRYKSWNNTFKEDSCAIIVSDPEGSHEGFGNEHWD